MTKAQTKTIFDKSRKRLEEIEKERRELLEILKREPNNSLFDLTVKNLLIDAVSKHKNKVKAAKYLGITYRRLYSLSAKYNVPLKRT